MNDKGAVICFSKKNFKKILFPVTRFWVLCAIPVNKLDLYMQEYYKKTAGLIAKEIVGGLSQKEKEELD
ncbi:MAG: hypothetical protein WDA19_11720, partial [Mariniphaga sp.]